MKSSGKTALVMIAAMLPAAFAWAGEEGETSSGVRLFLDLLPLLILFGLLFFILRRANKRNGPYMERAMLHMERLEKQNEEIIGLLRDVAGKSRSPVPPPPPPDAGTAVRSSVE